MSCHSIIARRMGTVPRRMGSMMPSTNRPPRSGASRTRYSVMAYAASVEHTRVSITVETVTMMLFW